MRLSQGGYTIIELLIVLGISAVMLSTAIVAFGGQQNRTQFIEGVRDLQTRLQLVLSEVATNTYPNLQGYICTANTSGVTINTNGTANDLGRNNDCIRIGSALYFYRNTNESGMIRATLVGRRFAANGLPSTTFKESQPKAFHSPGRDDYIFRSGIRINKIVDANNTTTSSILGIVSSLNGIGTPSTSQPSNTNNTSGSSNPSSQAFSIGLLGDGPYTIGAREEVGDQNSGRMASAITTSLSNKDISQIADLPSGQYVVCVESTPVLGFGRQFATITISGSGTTTQVGTEINGGICS